MQNLLFIQMPNLPKKKMNSNLSNKSEIFFPIDFWYNKFGSSMLLDSLHLYALLPLSLIGAVLNLLSFSILSQITFSNIVFYNYMRVYTFNSMLVNMILALFFWPNTLRTFSFSNTYAAAFYKSFIYVPFINATVLFGSLIDILISLERLFKLYPHLNTRFNKIPISKIITTFLVVTAVLCFQYLLKFTPVYIDVPLNASTAFRIHFTASTRFTDSLWGKVVNYLVYFIRDVIFLFAETGLNICMALKLSQQIKNKLKLTQTPHPNRQSLSKSEQKTSQMVIIMCSLSTLEHIFFFTMAVNFDYHMNYEAFMLGVAANICITLKHCSNLLLFYYFNAPFRHGFKRHLGLLKGETWSFSIKTFFRIAICLVKKYRVLKIFKKGVFIYKISKFMMMFLKWFSKSVFILIFYRHQLDVTILK